MPAPLYDPKYCDLAIAAGKRGETILSLASELGITRQTIYEWESTQDDFAVALQRMREESKAWLLQHVQRHLLDEKDIRINGTALTTYLWLAHRESTSSIHSCSLDLPDEYKSAEPARKREILSECLQKGKVTTAQAQILSSIIAQEYEEKEGYKLKKLLEEVKEKTAHV